MNKCLREFDEQAFINGIRQEEASKIAEKMFAKGYSLEEVSDIIDWLPCCGILVPSPEWHTTEVTIDAAWRYIVKMCVTREHG